MTLLYLTPAQCRMARAYLQWSQPELAERAGLVAMTVSKFESGSGHTGNDTIAKIAGVFELAGIEMLANGGVAPSRGLVTVLEGPDANYRVMDDVFHTLKEQGGEVLIAGLSEAAPNETERRAFVLDHIEKLKSAGITERILLKHGDRNVLAPADWYRWLPASARIGAPFHLYGNKIAMKDLGPPQRIVVIEEAVFAATVRGLFEIVWLASSPIEAPS